MHCIKKYLLISACLLYLLPCPLLADIPPHHKSFYATDASEYLSPNEYAFLSGSDKNKINTLLSRRAAELTQLSDEFDQLYYDFPSPCCGHPDRYENRPSRTGAYYLPGEIHSSHWGCFACKKKAGEHSIRSKGETYANHYQARCSYYDKEMMKIVDNAKALSSPKNSSGHAPTPAVLPARKPVNSASKSELRDEKTTPPDATAQPADGNKASVPVPPGKAAGAAAAAGLVSLFGSLLFSRAMGMDLSSIKDAVDVLFGPANPPAPSMPPQTETVTAPQPPAAPAVEYNEGEVNAFGEIYSLNYGWCSPDEYERNQAVSHHIEQVNSGINAAPDAVAQELGNTWTDSQQKLDNMRETGRYVELSTKLAENFGAEEEKAWCMDFINRHAQAGPDGYNLDPATARQMYEGLKKQMYTSGQIANLAETGYQKAVADELARKTEVVIQIRDNAARANRLLAKFDPTGTGGKIIDFQQGAYGAIDGYEKGGIAGAAESVALTIADNYTQGYASGNYNALKESYAGQGLSDESVLERLAKANFETANNKYNVLDHAGKAASNLMDGEIGAAFDSTLDAHDAKDSLREDYGKAKDWATGRQAATPEHAPAPQTDTLPDTTPAPSDKSLGTLRRESFEVTRRSMDNEIKMMQELNRIADIPDAAQRQAELVKARNADPSIFNVVQKQLHPDTAGAITETNRMLSDKVVERQAQILQDRGYDASVRLTGKAGGADTDGFWTLKDGSGNAVSDTETRQLAADALEQASSELLHPLGTDAEQMGHKIMNESPEKFAADPDDLGIKSRDGKLVDGKLVFEDHAQTGEHWPSGNKAEAARQAALTAPGDRIANTAMTKDNAASLGEVLKTKTAHLDDIAHAKGAVSEADMRDLAREITKTNNRTFLPMADKAGVKPTVEYRDLMQKLMLVKDGDISSAHLPSRQEIERILAENVNMLKDAIKD